MLLEFNLSIHRSTSNKITGNVTAADFEKQEKMKNKKLRK